MNAHKPFNPAPAAGLASPLTGPAANPIGAAAMPALHGPTGGTGAPNPSTLPPLPICGKCNRNPYGCVCNAPDGTEDMTPVEDMKRIMPELFDGSSWLRAERSALFMGGK